MTKKLAQQIHALPTTPGVYFFKGSDQTILYIGKAKNIKKRVESHFKKGGSAFNFYHKVRAVDFVRTPLEKDALVLEAALVKKYQPRYNVELKDDKNFFFVAFSRQELPRVFITHQPKKQDAHCIGPFVAGKELKQFLANTRKLFPYKTCVNKKDVPCLYYHLGLCSAHGTRARDYPHIIAGLKTFLSIYQNQKNRIEGYDISNTQGSLSVGSLAVFVNNKPSKQWYRKFKIRSTSHANDPTSLREIIDRRLRHSQWPFPDCIVIDGGRAQLSALKHITLPLVALAKQGEPRVSFFTKKKGVFRNQTNGYLLSPYSHMRVALDQLPLEVKNVLLSLRNEAHRFAITYHRLRQVKNIKKK